MNRIQIVDGTLREGEQTPGVCFTREEKLEMARALDRVGVPILDAGMPSVSVDERASISAMAELGLKASIGVSARMSALEVEQALECGAEEIFLICPVSPLHLKSKLGMDEKGVMELAGNVVGFASAKGLVVNLVAEDATRAEIPFMADILSRARDRGAERAFICDTVGIIDPFSMKDLINKLRDEIPDDMALGVHCHNDLGLGTANTL
ncbi:MAG: 2-isopropylmalate synthase, partial [Deltaproteobacteria bacterium]|nr:2-isopropylmalate synthase [Deltaproteobacteria bacterium]